MASVVQTRTPRRILVIEDEALLRRAYQRVLAPPHTVVHAADGSRALEILADDRDFEVILCDLMMPGIDGPGFYEALSALAPSVCERVVFVSGGAFTQRCVEFIARVGPLVLEKPVPRLVLLDTIESIAHRPAAQG